MSLIFDGHLDLAMNALLYERDQALAVRDIREREARVESDEPGTATNSLFDMQQAGVACCVSTLIARTKPVDLARLPSKFDIDWPTQNMAYAIARGQLAYYEQLAAQGVIRVIRSVQDLTDHWQQWTTATGDAVGPFLTPVPDNGRPPVGIIVTLEGADPIVEPTQIHDWYALGLRTLMLAHFGPSCYAMGTVPGDGSIPDAPLSAMGRALLVEMEALKMPLDLTHLCDMSFFEAAERFNGRIYASHSNCRAIAHSPRQITDEQIKIILERDGVIGMVMSNGMLRPRGKKSTSAERDSEVTLETVAIHMDHICQIAGDSRHAAIGSDLDGGFGAEHTPTDLDTTTDLHRLAPLLAARGYNSDDLANLLGGNWRRFYSETLPAE